jgi:hypothetical protein
MQSDKASTVEQRMEGVDWNPFDEHEEEGQRGVCVCVCVCLVSLGGRCGRHEWAVSDVLCYAVCVRACFLVCEAEAMAAEAAEELFEAEMPTHGEQALPMQPTGGDADEVCVWRACCAVCVCVL